MEIKVDPEQLLAVHGKLDSAWKEYSGVVAWQGEPRLSASEAMDQFEIRVKQLESLAREYSALLSNDSWKLHQMTLSYVDYDDAEAKKFKQSLYDNRGIGDRLESRDDRGIGKSEESRWHKAPTTESSAYDDTPFNGKG